MSPRSLAYISGSVLSVVGAFMGSALIVTTIYREWSDVIPFLLAVVATVSCGLVLRYLGREAVVSTREAFAAVALTWMTMTLFGALPFLLSGAIPSVTDAVFESASGFTATGSSIVPDPGALTHGSLYWRAITQWLGGMGVVVFAVAFIPGLGIGGLRLAEAEAPGPTAERITPRFQETARRLWGIFLGFTVTQTILLMTAGMTLFEGVTHSFTTLSGGGFSTESASMGAFSAYSQWIVIVFMIAGGTSFALHARGLTRPSEYWHNAELRLFLWFVVLASGAMALGTWGGRVVDTVRDAVFTTTSIITTTGFVTADYQLWSPPLHVIVIGLMFVGAMAGSTSGSVKVYRIEVVAGSIRKVIRRLVHPHAVEPVRSGRVIVSSRLVGVISSFLILYVFIFFAGTIALSIISSWAGSHEMGLVTSASAVATSLGNIGPGLDHVGPTTTFVLVPTMGKWLLASLMIVGRLEILPVLVLLNREAWRR